MSTPGPEIIEVFLQEASQHLQFLREYSGILQDPYPANEDIERLYISAHTLTGTSASYGFPLFSDVSGKLAHIFQYVLNTSIGQDAAGPLVEFISEAVALLESDLLMISATGAEALEDMDAFKQRYPFAFQQAAEPEPAVQMGSPVNPPEEVLTAEGTWAPATEAAVVATPAGEVPIPDLPPDGEVPAEILEFFVPEAEEHLQIITECLLTLETSTNPQDIHRLFRAMHTIKGSAAQVGLQRISRVAHRAEDLVGRLRDGQLRPSAQIVDLCLEAVDVLKKFIYRKWTDEATIQASVKSLLGRIARLAPEELEIEGAPAALVASAQPETEVAPAATVVATAEELKAAMAAAAHITTQQQDASVGQQAERGQDALATAGETPALHSGRANAGHQAHPVPSTQSPAQVSATTAAGALPELKVEPDPNVPPDLEIVTGRGEPIAVPQSKSVRISLERLDQMMNAVGELVINRTRMLGRLAELERLADVLNFSKARMSDKVGEFQEKYEFSLLSGGLGAAGGGYGRLGNGDSARGNMRDSAVRDPYPFRGGFSSYSNAYDPALADFSELEMDRYDDFSILSRSLTEISADITEVLSQLDGFVRRVDADIDEFTKLAHRLQDEITEARMVPIGNLYTRLSRTVRDAAKATGKRVQLTLAGAETELDNNIIQQISDPLIHLARNAVAHGIERDDERYQAGKSDHGNIAVRAYHRGNHIYIEVEDDGRGIDYDKVRATAVEAGLVDEDDAEELGERELLEFLFHPGFSTAPKKTELAGRGVGLDVVRSNISELNGEIDVETQKGLGTRFTLKVPLTLIISQALFVRCGNSVFALPLAFVEEIRRLRPADIEEVAGKMLTKVRDVTTEVVRLDTQLGLPPVEPVNGYYRLVIVNVAGRQVGLLVEEVLRKDEIVIKNLGEYLRNVKMFPGATIAPDGSLILLIDVNRLVAGEAIERRPLMTVANAARIFAPGAMALAAGEIPPAAIDPVVEEKVIVLADDSISVRKFVGRMLEKAGYRVKLAADGLEALEIASQSRCDLLITDLEMPRTNGYELMSHLRQQPETKKIPVLVVTSRAGAKHRERAMKEGASSFLVKPVQEEQLLAVVAELIGTATGEKKAPVADMAKAQSG